MHPSAVVTIFCPYARRTLRLPTTGVVRGSLLSSELSMNLPCFAVLLGLVAAGAAARTPPAEQEQNAWPLAVERRDPTTGAEYWSAAGPLVFRTPEKDGGVAHGLRPIWVQRDTAAGELRAGYFLYPLFSYSADATTYRWSVFELVRQGGRRAGAPAPESAFDRRRETEVFPFWFSRTTGDAERDYRGLFPLHGAVKDKLGIERLSWTLFPFYAQSERRGAVTTSTPWPFVRITRGAAQGWSVWPLYGHIERPGEYRRTTYLWPLGFNQVREPATDAPAGAPPRRDVGFIPFYTRRTGPGFVSENFVWPFFGYTVQTEPKRYEETRYFWPLFVQGRGDGVLINRWAPFYTHSNRNGSDKQWVAWPLLRHAEWQEGTVDRRRTQFFYFLFWGEEQRPAGRPDARPATLTHLWPFLSHWDDGAGRIQWQALSPLDVFFGRNEKVRLAWSPLFALARHEQMAPGRERTTLLWNAVSWESDRTRDSSEFHLGPILGVTRRGDDKQVALGRGLFGLRRTAGAGWRPFWLDFSRPPASKSPAATR